MAIIKTQPQLKQAAPATSGECIKGASGVCKWCEKGECWTSGQIEKPKSFGKGKGKGKGFGKGKGQGDLLSQLQQLLGGGGGKSWGKGGGAWNSGKFKVDKSGLENLASAAQELLEKLAPNKTDLDRRDTCFGEIDKLCKGLLGEDWKARIFGSVGSTFSTRSSDLDVTLYREAGLEANVTARTVLLQFLPVVEQHPSFEIIEVLRDARIPLLKVKFDGELEVDLSFQNTDAFRNTQLLRAYASLSSVRELVTLIKLWAKFEGVCGAPEGHLSSYSFTLMVIYFLQVDPLVKMPVFPTADFTGDQELPECARSWQCPLTLPVLIVRFFEFYVTKYRWGQEVVSVRNGQRIDARDVRNGERVYQLPSCESSSMPHIEDPILLDKNLNSVLGSQQNTVLRNKLCSAHGQIQLDRTPAGFITALSPMPVD